MNTIRLSICVPTYNFAEYIGDMLESVIAQSEDGVEIIIVDGASTDGTDTVVKDYQNRFKNLIYIRREKNYGLDLDLAKSIEISRGEYCWLLSSDDALTPGAISRLLEEIAAGHDIYLCNRIICDRKLNPVANQYWLANKCRDRVFELSDRLKFLEYLQLSRSIGAIFSYISSIVFKRSRWQDLSDDSRFIGTNYAHVGRFLAMRNNGCTLKYLFDPLVLCRGDNDSFLTKGRLNRFLIDLDAYEKLAHALVPNDTAIQIAFKTVMQREHAWYKWARIRHEVSRSEWQELERRLRGFGYSYPQLLIVRTLGRSRTLVTSALFLRSAALRIRRWFAKQQVQ